MWVSLLRNELLWNRGKGQEPLPTVSLGKKGKSRAMNKQRINPFQAQTLQGVSLRSLSSPHATSHSPQARGPPLGKVSLVPAPEMSHDVTCALAGGRCLCIWLHSRPPTTLPRGIKPLSWMMERSRAYLSCSNWCELTKLHVETNLVSSSSHELSSQIKLWWCSLYNEDFIARYHHLTEGNVISMNKYGPCNSREREQQLAAGTGKGRRNDKRMEKLPPEEGPRGPRVFHEGGVGICTARGVQNHRGGGWDECTAALTTSTALEPADSCWS